MTGQELVKLLCTVDVDGHPFIKWADGQGGWQVELLDTFLDTAKISDRFETVELLDMEDMWVLVKQQFPDRVVRKVVHDQEVLLWQKERLKGTSSEACVPFSPQSLIRVYETEVILRRMNEDGKDAP